MSEPITREETYLAAIAGDGVDLPNPITREEMYLAAAAGMAVELPNPITRKEQFLQRVVETGGTGGGGVTIRNQNKTITQNGQYKADSGYTGLGTVTVNVPQEDPVLQDKTATQNGKYTADSGFDGLGTVTVAVPEPVLQDKTVTKNGEYTADSGYDGLGTVTVNVAASGGWDTAQEDGFIARTLTEYTNDRVTSMGEYCFYKFATLQKVSLPALTKTTNQSFGQCGKLVEANLPKLTALASNDFAQCASLTDVNIPLVHTISGNVFNGCKALPRIDLPSAKSISTKVFSNCTALNTVIIRTNTVCAISNVNAFEYTPFASGGTGGTVYVPSALIESYKTATNWSTLYAAGTCNFVAIEGSEYE